MTSPRLTLTARIAVVSFSAIAALTVPAGAEDASAAMEAYLQSHIAPFAEDPAVIAAVKDQNARTGDIDQAEIDRLDLVWRAEIGQPDSPMIASVLNIAASDFLRGQVEAAQGAITEVFVMDAKGLNVAASSVTSDYWQGDEAKFSETFSRGAGAHHFSDIELDESTDVYQGQISLTLTDPETGAPIGAMTVGVNAEALF